MKKGIDFYSSKTLELLSRTKTDNEHKYREIVFR